MLGCALADNAATLLPSFRSDVDEVVRLCHDGGVVLDDDYRVAFINEAMKHIDEFVDILLVQANGGFFNQVEVGMIGFAAANPGASFGEFGNEFDALRFTP